MTSIFSQYWSSGNPNTSAEYWYENNPEKDSSLNVTFLLSFENFVSCLVSKIYHHKDHNCKSKICQCLTNGCHKWYCWIWTIFEKLILKAPPHWSNIQEPRPIRVNKHNKNITGRTFFGHLVVWCWKRGIFNLNLSRMVF